MKIIRTDTNLPLRSPWRSLEQLSESWGLTRARTDLVVKALVRNGRMEERQCRDSEPPGREFRLVAS